MSAGVCKNNVEEMWPGPGRGAEQTASLPLSSSSQVLFVFVFSP